MLDSNSILYFAAINCVNDKSKAYWDGVSASLGVKASQYIDIAKYLSKNRIIPRRGDWASPWRTAVVPGFEMPAYDPDFKMSFEEVTYLKALDIKKIINKTAARVAVYYSGGIDSTVCLAALIKYLSSEEIKYVDVCLSSESIIENPYFFKKYIFNKFAIYDSAKIRYDFFQKNKNQDFYFLF